MPRISLWNPNRTNDYNYIDKMSREHMNLGGTGSYIHKYIGPTSGAGKDKAETIIDDVLFLENRSRTYDSTIYELRGHYTPQNADFDLTQFGLLPSNDQIFLEFHISEMVERIGRKLIAGDVIELPHLREFFTLDEDNPAFNKFFVIEDAYRSASGFGPRWWPHIWRIKAKAITASEEFSSILGERGEQIVTDEDGNRIGTKEADPGHGGAQGDDNLIESASTFKFDKEITDGVADEAECEVPHDPTFFTGHHYYVYEDDNGIPMIYWGTGDGVPPNGEPIRGQGEEFPEDMQDGEYFLRTDFEPPSLFFKQGCKFIRIEVDMRKCWTGQNQRLDTFIDNNSVTTNDDGSTEPERQPLSKVVKPKDGD